ncbi:polysaccharide pyruvyl transferase family protein [Microbacterium aureliae]
MRFTVPAIRGLGRRDQGDPLYLISTAGHPNYGDELITRAWLDYLAVRHPHREVWLDCPHPGRASHLFADTHPRLRVTNTLWELALSSPMHDPLADTERITRLVVELGSPRFDPGLLALRRMASVHLLGGGYLNALWQDNLGLVGALVALRAAFGIRLFATGQGLMPLTEQQAPWLASRFARFDHAEFRDEPSARLAGADVGLDDAFLALALDRPVFDARPSPDRMVLVQGDLRAWDDDDVRRTIRSFSGTAREVGMVEAIPPDDVRYLGATGSAERVYPFGHIWSDGLPARSGQRWLTSRFHFHLLAAAAGASGLIVQGEAGYYDVKHSSLLALGTGWSVLTAGDKPDAADATIEAGFPAHARELARRKLALADSLYPAR